MAGLKKKLTRSLMQGVRQVLRAFRIGSPSPMEPVVSLSRRQFLELFSVGLVDDCLATGDEFSAEEALLSCLAGRPPTSWPAFPARMTDIDSRDCEAVLDEARRILDNRFTIGSWEEVNFGASVDWTYDPTTDPVHRWTCELHRHRWLAVLTRAYRDTADERYAIKFDALMADWIRANPVPDRRDEANVAWTLMGVGMRCLIWPTTFGVFLRSDKFRPETRLLMLRSIVEHGRYLNCFETRLNHLLREANGLAHLALTFPEIREVSGWCDTAFARLEKALYEQVNSDGVQIELSTGYQWLAVEECEATAGLLRLAGRHAAAQDAEERLAAMYTVLAHVMRPDGTWPVLNDGFLENPRDCRERLRRAGAELKRPDLRYVGSCGAEGVQPVATSVPFQNGGWYVMRSGWSENAHWLVFNASGVGGFHGHEDRLSIDVCAYGEPLIVDAGNWSYNRNDPFRSYFVSSQAHNTVVPTGMSQVRRWDPQAYQPRRQWEDEAEWLSGEGFDFVSASYTGGYAEFSLYRPRDPDVVRGLRHWRAVLFVRPHYWIVLDQLETQQPLDCEMHFHTMPGVSVSAQDTRTWVLTGGNCGARLALATTAPLPTRLVKGSENPIQGWVNTGRCYDKSPATVLIRDLRVDDALTIATLLYPMPTEASVALRSFKQVPVEGAKGWGFQVDSESGTDYILVGLERGHRRLAGHEFSGRFSRLSTDRSGDVVERAEL